MWVQMALSKYAAISVGAMRRMWSSATKVIQDFEGNVLLGCPIWAARPQGHDQHAGGLCCDTMVQKESSKALLKAYEDTEVFVFDFPYEMPE